MRRALFLYNPTSGRHRERRLRDVTAAAEVFRRAGVEADIEATTGRGTAPKQARDAADRGYDTIVACGGDGTIHEIVQSLAGGPTALAVLPLGTGNGLAADLRVPREAKAAAEYLLNSKLHSLRLPRMEFDNPIDGINERSRYCVVGAGIGPDAEMAYRMTVAMKERWGMMAYYAQAWRQWLTYPFPEFEIEFSAGGSKRRERVTQVLAIRIEWFGGFLRRLAPGASLFRDDLRLVMIKSRRRWPYVKYVTGIQFNRSWTGDDIELAYATEFSCRPLTDGRIYAEADGELLGTLPVTIRMTQESINLLVP